MLIIQTPALEIKLNSANPYTYYSRAKMYERQGERRLSALDFERALKYGETDPVIQRFCQEYKDEQPLARRFCCCF